MSVDPLTDFQREILTGIPETLPNPPIDGPGPFAPSRGAELTNEDKVLAVRNALRYFKDWHAELAEEFAKELDKDGRIYMRRFRPHYEMKARLISEYPHRSQQAAAIMLMIQNNLDPHVAQYHRELITYGGNGAVFQNWAQYLLTMKYLAEMTDEQTLVLSSGHPLGVFPSHPDAPRVVITNGMMVPNYSSKAQLNRFNALGVTQYGQMTAGSFMFIGPQGIVHGTRITLQNAERIRKRLRNDTGPDDLRGKVFVSSGLGGMSVAQAKAAVISGCVGVIAEVNDEVVERRINDGYVARENLFAETERLKLLDRLEQARTACEGIALVYRGNVVDLWKCLVDENVAVDLGSDQTSCHNIDGLGYCPAGMSYREADTLCLNNKAGFRRAVESSLREHVGYINKMWDRGMYFWDYGNMFLKEAGLAGAEVFRDNRPETLSTEYIDGSPYRYKSYVEAFMGPLYFDHGFGPFRWVCCSGEPSDLDATDAIAISVLEEMQTEDLGAVRNQIEDNLRWIREAKGHELVVGSQARILYADADGRMRISKAINDAIRLGTISAPVVIGRDHHDVSGTDSPFRETANIDDGSRYTADMAVQNVIGDAFRGATWVSLHNGGGVGWGEAINGGFGLVLDGSPEAERRLNSMLFWDVNNGIARRAWARNPHAINAIERAMEASSGLLQVTMPNEADAEMVRETFEKLRARRNDLPDGTAP